MTGYTSAASQSLEELAADEMRRRDVPGVALALIEDAGVTTSVEVGRGSMEGDEPIDRGTVFEGASLGKPLLAQAALTLASGGRLSLEEPMGTLVDIPKSLRELRLEAMTVRMMLNHTTGLTWSADGRGDLEVVGPPGVFKYSGAAYFVLQNVLQEVLGRPLSDFMAEFVFQPLQLRDTAYGWHDRFAPVVAQGHDHRGRSLPKSKVDPARADSASALHTTAVDYARFLAALVAPDGTVPAPVREAMLTPTVEVDEAWGGGPPERTRWSLGMGISDLEDGEAHAWHWGWNDGFRSFATVTVDGRRGVVVMTNGDGGLWVCKRVVTAFLGSVHPAFRWLEH